MNSADLNDLLARLGLTEYEGKTLSTLFRLREAEAPSISRASQVPKTRVYDVLEKLVNKNLVIEIKGRPKRYRAVNAQKALRYLVESRKSELTQLEGKIAEFKDFFAEPGRAEEASGETVMKVKDKHDFERILAQELEKAKDSIVGFAELSDRQSIVKEAIEGAKSKNVSIKLLNAFPTEWLKRSAKELRHFEHGLNAFIIDDRKIVLALSDFKRSKPEYHFTIFHENKPMVNALKHYFERCWQQGKPV